MISMLWLSSLWQYNVSLVCQHGLHLISLLFSLVWRGRSRTHRMPSKSPSCSGCWCWCDHGCCPYQGFIWNHCHPIQCHCNHSLVQVWVNFHQTPFAVSTSAFILWFVLWWQLYFWHHHPKLSVGFTKALSNYQVYVQSIHLGCWSAEGVCEQENPPWVILWTLQGTLSRP